MREGIPPRGPIFHAAANALVVPPGVEQYVAEGQAALLRLHTLCGCVRSERVVGGMVDGGVWMMDVG